MNYINIREKRTKFKSVTLIKREFIEYRKTSRIINFLFFFSILPDYDEVLIKTQYMFVKNIDGNHLQCGFEIFPRACYKYYFLEAKYKIRKELNK